MSSLRFIPPNVNLFEVLARALEINLAPGANLYATVIASTIRRTAAIIAPCSRRELLAQVSRALTRCLEDLPEGILSELIDDLIVGGDLVEAPALLQDHDEAPILIFCRQPTFCRSGTRVHLFGAAPDDAPFLPKSVMREVSWDGGLRYLTTGTDPAICATFARMGLQELPSGEWLSSPRRESPSRLIEQLRAMMVARGREDRLVGMRWLTSPPGYCPYRQRWNEETNEEGLLIARAPQPYGADAWFLAERGDRSIRFLQLPLEEFPKDRGCDLAWRVQLALDFIANKPAWYEIVTDLDSIKLTVSFPIPSPERLALIYLGGRREVTTSPYEFRLSASSLPAAEKILGGIYFVSRGAA